MVKNRMNSTEEPQNKRKSFISVFYFLLSPILVRLGQKIFSTWMEKPQSYYFFHNL